MDQVQVLTLNRRDMQSKFGYVMISKIRGAFGGRFARELCLSAGFAVPLRCTQKVHLSTSTQTLPPVICHCV